MVVLMFKNLDIPEGFTHKASDWQIAHDKYFKDIVVESRNDDKHLTSILFDVDLDPDKTYFARARVIMDYGPSDWSDIDIVRTEDLNQIDLDIDIPSTVGAPEVKVDFPYSRVPQTGFSVSTDNFSSNSNSKHLATDYFITTLDGTVVYSELGNETNLNKFLVKGVLLPTNNFYKIKVAHISSSNDVSEFGERLIYVPDASEIELTKNINGKTASQYGLEVNLKPVEDVESISIKLYMVGADFPVKTFEISEDKFIFDVPKTAFQNPNSTYLLEVQYTYINSTKSNIKYFVLTEA